jgi:hypothetical protein
LNWKKINMYITFNIYCHKRIHIQET